MGCVPGALQVLVSRDRVRYGGPGPLSSRLDDE